MGKNDFPISKLKKRRKKMAEKKLRNVNASLCLKKIKDFLGDPQSGQKKNMAELALEHLESIHGGTGYIGCKKDRRED